MTPPDSPPPITSLQNSLVKQLRKLHQTKGRRTQNRVLLEGTNLATLAVQLQCVLEHVCVTPTWATQHPDLNQSLREKAQHYRWVSTEVMARLASTTSPDGVVLTMVSGTLWPSPPDQPSLALVLETIQDPGNLGTIIRTAAATSVEGIWYSSDCVDPESPKVLRASAGYSFQVPQRKSTDLQKRLKRFRLQNLQLVATTPTATQEFWHLDFRPPTLFLFGSEGQGLSQDVLSLATHQVKIPQAPGVESLNVAIAVAVMLYEVQRQRQC